VSRSVKKGPYVDTKLAVRVENASATGSKEPIRTWARASMVAPEFVGHTFEVHNGRHFIKVYITEDMVGHRLGEFAQTRTFRGHKKKD